jgi:hypothetical protein
MKFEISHTLPADVETVLRVMQEKAYYEFLQANHPSVDRIEMLSQEEVGSIVRRRVHYQPKPIIRSVGPKKVPPEAMAWVEESELDRANRRVTFTNVAVHREVKRRLINHGTITFADAGDGKTRRVVAGELTVKFPLLGGIAERIIYNKAKEILDGEAEQFARYVAQQG